MYADPSLLGQHAGYSPCFPTVETADDGKTHTFQAYVKVFVTKIKRGTFATSVTVNIANDHVGRCFLG